MIGLWIEHSNDIGEYIMAEPLKNIYNEKFLIDFAKIIKNEYGLFDEKAFVTSILDDTWDELELKQRMRRISEILGEFLPKDYVEAIEILKKIKNFCVGFPYIVFSDFVEVYGQDIENYDVSMSALELFTECSSSEFAIRPFIINNTIETMNYMKKWAESENEHIRRLASEGCRPRLPWSMALPMFKNDPKEVLEILELLKNDESLYVRKSVANNLNDISKDNPDVVVETVKRWKSENNDYINWIVRHGCRTLIKQKNEEAMKIFGYDTNIKTNNPKLAISKKEITTKDETGLSYSVDIIIDKPTHIRLEYGIYFVKANGSTSLKKFLIVDKTINDTLKLEGVKKHNWVERTTRKHYSGIHKVVLILNGKELEEDRLNLSV